MADIEEELRLAAGLTMLREKAGLSQRDLAKRMGVSQPRITAIEQSRNVTIDVLEQYVAALGGRLELTVVKGRRRIPLVAAQRRRARKGSHTRAARSRRKPASGSARGYAP